MCLILFAHAAHPEYRLVLAANRDEFYARPTSPAAPWPDAPHLVAGRDLRGGGTWLGVTRDGRWAAVTNYRDPAERRPDAPSRGLLVADFLRGEGSAREHLAALAPRADRYAGFNLLLGDAEGVHWFSNRAPGASRALEPGVYGLSNHLLDTPWPKVERGKRELERLLRAGPDPEAMLELLMDRAHAADHELPDSGVPRALERALSASFILTPDYGTRASTALLVDRAGGIVLEERTFRPGRPGYSRSRHRLSR